MSVVLSVFLLLLLVRLVAQVWLDVLNLGEVRRHADAPPAGIADVMSDENYLRSVAYTTAKLKFSIVD